MTARITMIGGGSYHWAPRLLSDFANTPALEDAEIVLHDLDMAKVGRMVAYGEQIAAQRNIKLAVRGEADRKKALRGAEFVVSAFSVGGFDSMRYDLEIPERYGIQQPIGDSIGPGGVMRALRSIPVVLGFARDAAEVAPDALFINVSNPLSALTRTIAKETGIRVVGLCNELIGCAYVLSLLTDAPMHLIDPTVAGVNHFPMIVALRFGEQDGFAELRSLLDHIDERGAEPIWMTPPEPMHWTKYSDGEQWTKADVVANTPVKLELFRRFGVLPGAHDHHVTEFMPGFVNEQNEHGKNWRITHYGLSGHMEDADDDERDFEERMKSEEVTRFPSGELVANLIDGVVSGVARALPMNLPNTGQVPALPPDVVVEAMGIADGSGVRPRDVATVPGILGEYVRRTVVAQELTVDAGLSGDRTLAFEAMLADPIAGRLPYESVAAMTGEMLDALDPWLPQFS
jgi:alpha-galactosidase